MVKGFESLINVVRTNKLKMLTSLDQKVSGPVQRVPLSLPQTTTRPPADRRDLTHSVGAYVEHGWF
jgi:hypothetical protein